MRWSAAATLTGLALGLAAAEARELRATPDSYRQRLAELRPGDTLVLAPGDYRGGLPLHRLAGTAAAPIVVAGPARGAPAVFHAAPGRNTVSIVDAAHLVLRDLQLEGHGLRVDAVKAEGHARFAHHITLERLSIRGHGHDQQTVGISTKCPAWGWTLRGNTIVGAGTGIYLGDSDGSAPFVAGLIEHNRVLDPLGYALQVKHQGPRPALAGMPAGASLTVIRHNVFAKRRPGDPRMARPNVLVGHFPLEGPGAGDRYAIHANLFLDNHHEALFQGEGNIALYANLFVNRHGDAIHIQPHNDIPRDVLVARNTVLATGTAIRILEREGAPPQPRRIAANALFAATPLAGAPADGNFAADLAAAPRWLRAPDAADGVLDLRPRRPWPASAAAAADIPAGLPGAAGDFDGRPWRAGSLGAYADGDAPLRRPPILEPGP